MFRRKFSRPERAMFAWVAVIVVFALPLASQQPAGSQSARWETRARMHGALFTKSSGTLTIGEDGISFRSEHGQTQKWMFQDVDTFSIKPHQLVLRIYANRSLHRPGEQSYDFDLDQPVPPAVAASVAREVSRPSRNIAFDPEAQAIANIPARHRKLTGGTNGTLRFREAGIDFIANSPADSRSWRWADLQALSQPDPYHLLVFGYRDTYTFQLKKALSPPVLNRAMDEIYKSSGAEPPSIESNTTGGGHAQVP